MHFIPIYFCPSPLIASISLTVGYESNLQKNVDRKQVKYKDLIAEQSKHFKSVKFVSLSICFFLQRMPNVPENVKRI